RLRQCARWRARLLCGEAHRTSPPPALVRVDQPAGDQRWPVGGVADRADEAVVLIAEVAGERGDVTEDRAVVRRWRGVRDQAAPVGGHVDRWSLFEPWA